MKIAVIGGSGLIGSKLVKQLLRDDHTILAASPTTGVNTITGHGLNDVLKGTDVVVDVVNSPSLGGKAALDFFQRSTMNLLTAALYEGVKHHIVLSIVGADRMPDSGYMRAKIAQEELIKESGMPYTILRSTQFFELAGRIAEGGMSGDSIHIPSAPLQPIAGDELASFLSELVTDSPRNGTIEVAGPVAMPMYDFIRYYLNAIEDPHQLVLDEQARYFGAELNEVSLLPGEHSRLGKIKYEDWFRNQLAVY